MKKLKLFLASLICVLCICPAFAGCSTNNAEYVEDSFTYKLESYSYGTQWFDSSFELKIEEVGKYKVEYTLYGDYSNETSYRWKLELSDEFKSEKTDSHKVSYYGYANTNSPTLKITIKDIKITKLKDDSFYTDIALGLGISAAVLTVAVVTLFVLEKTGVIKTKKREE
ncbi:MAG: hypothetical protein K2K60_01010 [Clostridia bacterium]|nr:hypothetical protein [Clostridia bacterium]